MRSVIRFLNAKGERPAEIYKTIFAVCDNVMNRQNVRKLCREFSEGRTDVHDEQRRGRPSLISDDFLQEIEGKIRPNRRAMIGELHHLIPEVYVTRIYSNWMTYQTMDRPPRKFPNFWGVKLTFEEYVNNKVTRIKIYEKKIRLIFGNT